METLQSKNGERSEGPLVLVVDDDPSMRWAIKKRLLIEGLRVVTARDGETALAELRDSNADLVLLDIVMPDVDGFQVCKRIKTDPRTWLTPVILVSALGDTPDRIRGIEAGADGFLRKPLDDLEFMSTVQMRLVAKRRLDELEPIESVTLSMARAIEGRDSETGVHADRLSRLATALGAQLGLPEEDLTALWRAGILHDIGKIAIPDSVLLKPGPLTAEERNVMKKHTLLGEEMLMPLTSLRAVLPIVRHHHERFDGSGYPDGLAGDDIPLTARILQMVDIYDALRSVRPYKPSMSAKNALDVMAFEVERGLLDARLFAEFSALERTLEEGEYAPPFTPASEQRLSA